MAADNSIVAREGQLEDVQQSLTTGLSAPSASKGAATLRDLLAMAVDDGASDKGSQREQQSLDGESQSEPSVDSDAEDKFIKLLEDEEDNFLESAGAEADGRAAKRPRKGQASGSAGEQQGSSGANPGSVATHQILST